jgi:drug/metabolite transporter (DMT)-like permease
MLALGFGMVAALCWAVHDLCVRFVTQDGAIFPALMAVVFAGTVAVLPFAFWIGDWNAMGPQAYGLSILSGVCFTVASVALYNAFGIGPVRLVAPIIGSYPILSVAWAAYNGQAITTGQWWAVGLVVGGVALVSILSDESESNGSQVKAILWGLLSSVGFFTTFATGQAASVAGDELPVTLITRTVCIILLLGILVMQAGPKIPAKGNWLLLSVMGVLDAIALSLVMSAGTLYRPEFAAVAASTFGAITIILAWTFLKERMTFGQWAGVGLTFTGIGYLAL